MCQANDDTTKVQQPPASSSSLKFYQNFSALLGLAASALLIAVIVLAVDRNDTNSSNEVLAKLATTGPPPGDNPCAGKKPDLANVQCIIDEVEMTKEQSGANVTAGYKVCLVNVHMYLVILLFAH